MMLNEHENVEVESLRVFVLTPRSRRFRIPSGRCLELLSQPKTGTKHPSCSAVSTADFTVVYVSLEVLKHAQTCQGQLPSVQVGGAALAL